MVRDLNGKRATVVGLARSGVGAANLLSRLGAAVTVTDKKKPQELAGFLDHLDPAVKKELGHHPLSLFEETDLIVISPGVPLTIAPLRQAAARGIPVIGELELAYQLISGDALPQAKRPLLLAVTGTNGKSTTASLVYAMMKNGGFGTLFGGNIGTALTEVLSGSTEQGGRAECFVVEVSSFQLETIETFRPTCASILNITPDHLDRYHSLEEYTGAKCRIALNQREGDVLILNADDEMTEEVLNRIKGSPRILYFSRKRPVEGAYYREGRIVFSIPRLQGVTAPPDFAVPGSAIAIKGVHNIENAMAASLMALVSGCGADAVAETLRSFPGLEHRLEAVRELDGVTFINDSKGTNVGAVIKSLESFSEPVVLIAGGRDKDSDFAVLRPLVKERVKALVLIGEAREKLRKALGDVAQTVMEDDFQSAVARAKQLAAPGDVVLLSPACASFDMFKDFEDRGRQFKKLVNAL